MRNDNQVAGNFLFKLRVVYSDKSFENDNRNTLKSSCLHGFYYYIYINESTRARIGLEQIGTERYSGS